MSTAVVGVGLVLDFEAIVGVCRANYGDYAPETIFACEVQVALVPAGAAEDSAGAIFHEHEIGDKQR